MRFPTVGKFRYRRLSPTKHVPGAGISVSAGIPDFRSESGLFQTLKRDNPKEALSSGRDLFDASVFNVSYRPSMFDFPRLCMENLYCLNHHACLLLMDGDGLTHV